MKFYDNKTNDDKIIEWIKETENNYEIKLLDNDNIIKLEKNNLVYNEKIKEMLEQATKRDKELYYKYKKHLVGDIKALVKATVLFAFISKGNTQLLGCILFVIYLFYLKYVINDLSKYNELKKYHTFLEIKEELEKRENVDILDVIEFDKIYQDPRGIKIDNLDNYSSHDISMIKKELKRRNQEKLN